MANVKDFNEFTFSGVIGKKPEKKPNDKMTIVETVIEQSYTYNHTLVTKCLTVTGFHDNGRTLLGLNIGDRVMVKGSISTKPYQDKRSGETKFFTSHVAEGIFVSVGNSADNTVPRSTVEVKAEFDDSSIPF